MKSLEFREFKSEFNQDKFFKCRDSSIRIILNHLRLEGQTRPDKLGLCCGIITGYLKPKRPEEEAFEYALKLLEENKILQYDNKNTLWKLAPGIEINSQGVILYRSFFIGRDRYHYDYSLMPTNQWKQYDTDQDFSHFGIWLNSDERIIVTFAEGDEVISVCPTAESFKAELEHMESFYGSPPPAFTVIEKDGNITRYYTQRTKPNLVCPVCSVELDEVQDHLIQCEEAAKICTDCEAGGWYLDESGAACLDDQGISGEIPGGESVELVLEPSANVNEESTK